MKKTFVLVKIQTFILKGLRTANLILLNRSVGYIDMITFKCGRYMLKFKILSYPPDNKYSRRSAR